MIDPYRASWERARFDRWRCLSELPAEDLARMAHVPYEPLRDHPAFGISHHSRAEVRRRYHKGSYKARLVIRVLNDELPWGCAVAELVGVS